MIFQEDENRWMLDLECVGVRAIVSTSALVALATIRLPALKMTLINCPVFASNGKRWVALPSKRETGWRYVPMIAFDSPDMLHEFGDAAIKAIERFAPAIFEGR